MKTTSDLKAAFGKNNDKTKSAHGKRDWSGLKQIEQRLSRVEAQIKRLHQLMDGILDILLEEENQGKTQQKGDK